MYYNYEVYLNSLSSVNVAVRRWRHLEFSWSGVLYTHWLLSNINGRDYFVNAPSQWETKLHRNVVSHWLVAYKKLSLKCPLLMMQSKAYRWMNILVFSSPSTLIIHLLNYLKLWWFFLFPGEYMPHWVETGKYNMTKVTVTNEQTFFFQETTRKLHRGALTFKLIP